MKLVRRLALATVLIGLALLGVLLVVGSPIDAAAYTPPAKPALVGLLTPNDALVTTERLAVGQLHGGEDVAIDAVGRLYAGAEDGRIVRVSFDTAGRESVETFATIDHGRPLGLAFDAGGNLIVADARRGLLAIDPAGSVTVLADTAAGIPFGFTDDVDIASDGTIYFSDASTRFGVDDYLLDLLESRPYGRLLAFDPTTSKTTVVADGFYFANGVALSRDEDFVLVNETYRYRIQRCSLKGPARGRCEIFIDNLPGFPDGVASDGEGTFWVALYTVRNDQTDRLHPRPFFKNLLARLPRSLWPKPEPYGLVLALDEAGNVVQTLHDPSAATVHGITSVEPHGGALYLGQPQGGLDRTLASGYFSQPPVNRFAPAML